MHFAKAVPSGLIPCLSSKNSIQSIGPRRFRGTQRLLKQSTSQQTSWIGSRRGMPMQNRAPCLHCGFSKELSRLCASTRFRESRTASTNAIPSLIQCQSVSHVSTARPVFFPRNGQGCHFERLPIDDLFRSRSRMRLQNGSVSQGPG